MSSSKLKSVWDKVVIAILGKPCDSGRPHRWQKSKITGNKYCMHPECVTDRHASHELSRIMSSIRAKNHLLDRISILEENNKTAFDNGCQHGMKMERKKLFNTLLQSRQLLLDTLAPIGINEHRVRQFIEWYETQRDPRVNPKQDDVTYKICKNIVELEATLTEASQDDVQLT